MTPIMVVALFMLVVQNSILSITMRFTFLHNNGVPYIPSTAVFCAEILKLMIATGLAFFSDSKGDIYKFLNQCHVDLIKNYQDWFKLMVPSVLYILQNSLQYYSMSCLSAPVFQVLYQMKLITTAFFAVVILSKKLGLNQWASIVALAAGVGLVQLSQTNDDADQKVNSIAGLISVLCGCLTSGFAGVYFELVLKSSPATSIWMRNIQLGTIGAVVAGIGCYFRDYDHIAEKGFFIGYNEYVATVIFLAAAGGLIVAVVVKYADNVLKGFATSISILLSSIISYYYFHDVDINGYFIVGAMTVLASVYLYGVPSQDTFKGTASNTTSSNSNGNLSSK